MKIFFLFVLIILFLSLVPVGSEVRRFSNEESLDSEGGDFELGVFKSNTSLPAWYLGLWYKQDPSKVILWVLNRERPLPSPLCALESSKSKDDELLLLRDEYSNVVWKSSFNANGETAIKLLGTGNLVVVGSNNTTLWQSFDYPSDTLLPEMKLGIGPDSGLRSWTSPDNPREGRYVFIIDEHISIDDRQEFTSYLFDKARRGKYILDKWNGVTFGNMPHILKLGEGGFSLNRGSSMSKLTLNSSGFLELYTWMPRLVAWKPNWSFSYERRTKGSNSKIIIITVVVVVVVILGAALLVYCLWKQWRKKRTNIGEQRDLELVQEIQALERLPLVELSLLKVATQNFAEANILGKGGFGTVYKGTYPDGRHIAVKRVNSSQGTDEFKNEVASILSVNHVNIVQLQGICCEEGERIFVYEFLENSSLDRHLFDDTRSRFLNWELRFRILKGIAEGLSYMHNFTNTKILHRDVKPSNVLLDEAMVPKIADMGLAKMMDSGQAVTDRVAGTYGYMSREYATQNLLSEKSDVFSYGVTVLETITGRRNMEYCKTVQGDSLLDYVWRCWTQDDGILACDRGITHGPFAEDEVLRVIHIGLLCVQDLPEDRPDMKDITIYLSSPELKLPPPSKPDFYIARALRGEPADPGAASSSSAVSETVSFKDYTFSEIVPK